MTVRHEYVLNLADFAPDEGPPLPAELQLRAPQPADLQRLAELMIDAYRGTTDYDGETVADAVREVQAYLDGQRPGTPLLRESHLALAGAQPAGACLVALWPARQAVVIAYVMTHARWQNAGVGRYLVSTVLRRLDQAGYRQVRAVITEGNIPSERLFTRLGFARVRDAAAPG